MKFNSSILARRVSFLGRVIDIGLITLGIALFLTALARVLGLSHEPLSGAQVLQGFLGLIALLVGGLHVSSSNLEKYYSNKNLIKAVALFPVISMAILIPYRLNLQDLDSYARRIGEGSLIEWLAFILLLFSSVLFTISGRVKKANLAHKILIGLGACSFLLAMEEMSWGQMIFSWKPPQIFEQINIQGETNLHNLSFVYDSTWKIAAVVFVVLTVLSLIRGFLEKTNKIYPQTISDALLPPFFLFSYFCLAALIYMGVFWGRDYGKIPILISREQEIGELFFALGVFIHSARIYLKWTDN